MSLSGEQVLPKDMFSSIIQPEAKYQQTYQALDKDELFPSGQYKNQFWVLQPELQRLTMLGIHGQFAWFDLKHDITMVGVGSYPKQDGPLMMQSLQTLWSTVAEKILEP